MSSSITVAGQLVLTEEQYATIETLAATNYSIHNIATLLDINPFVLEREYRNPESKVRHHYNKGVLQAAYEIDEKLLENAKSGNITATQESKKASEKRAFENHKMRILNEF